MKRWTREEHVRHAEKPEPKKSDQVFTVPDIREELDDAAAE